MYTREETILLNIFMKRMLSHNHSFDDVVYKPVSVCVSKGFNSVLYIYIQFDKSEPYEVPQYRNQITQLAAAYGLDVFVFTIFLVMLRPDGVSNYSYASFDYIIYRDLTTEGELKLID